MALPRIQPERFYDLVVQVAIIRPGPIVGDMVHPYINRRRGREPVTYAHPTLEPILERTLGVPLFQEQILRVAMAVAGFSPSAADRLRRAMSRARRRPTWRSCARRSSTARQGWARTRTRSSARSPRSPNSDSARATLRRSRSRRITPRLKLYYPAEFYVGLFNNQLMGFYSPAVIAGDAKRHGVAILQVDVNRLEGEGDRRGARPVRLHPVDSSNTIVAPPLSHPRRTARIRVREGTRHSEGHRGERERNGPFTSFDIRARAA
jgi:error-prone DNA polymerase